MYVIIMRQMFTFSLFRNKAEQIGKGAGLREAEEHAWKTSWFSFTLLNAYYLLILHNGALMWLWITSGSTSVFTIFLFSYLLSSPSCSQIKVSICFIYICVYINVYRRTKKEIHIDTVNGIQIQMRTCQMGQVGPRYITIRTNIYSSIMYMYIYINL